MGKCQEWSKYAECFSLGPPWGDIIQDHTEIYQPNKM